MIAARGRLWCSLIGCLALAAPASLRAQGASMSAGGEKPLPWHFQLSGSGTWYENAYFLGPASESNAWSAEGRATLSHVHRFKEGSFSLSGFGGALYYPDIEGFNQPTYGGAFSLDWAASRRTTLTLGQNYQRTNTRNLAAADTFGLPLPTSGIDYATTTLGLKHSFSQEWRLSVNGSFMAQRYDDERLVGGDQVNADASLERQVGRRGGVYLGYGYSRAWYQNDVPAQRSHQVLVGGRRKAEHGVGFELAGGFGYVESTQEFFPSARAGLTATGRHSSLSLLYYRDFGQAFGYGRQMIGDLASATFTWAASRRLGVNASYNFGYRRDPADESYTIISSVAQAGFNWNVGGGVGLDAYYAWERNDTTGSPLIEGGRVGATLRYGVGWR